MRLRSTLPGPSRAPKASFYQGQARNSEPFQKRVVKPRRKASRKILDWLILTVVGFLFLYSLVLKPEPHVSVNSYAYHPLAEYQAAANAASRGIRNTNKLTYNEGLITAYLRSRFPEVDQIKLSVPVVGQRPTLQIQIAKPQFTLSSSGGDFILDKTGVAVPKANINTAGLPSLSDKSGVLIKSGDHVLSADSVQFLNQVLAQLSSAKVPVSLIELPPLAQEFDLRTKDAGYYTKFYFGGDALTQSGQLLAARHEFAQKNIMPSEYLDVRVSGKVFYK